MRSIEKSHRILLVNPPYYRLYKSTYTYNKYPLSLGYLASIIKKETKWNVMVYNADFAVGSEIWSIRYLSGPGFKNYRRNLKDKSCSVWAQVKSTIAEFKPTIVGIYCNAPNSASAATVARMTKEISNRIIVVVGGPHPTSIGKETLNDLNIDVVVKGEGEQTIAELLNTMKNNESFDGVKGIIYRAEGEIIENTNRELIKDLDSLPFPHRHAREVLKDCEKYPISAFSSILSTRGCPYNCFFCGCRYVFGRKTRFRSIENVTDEIKSLQKMGIRWIEFLDDSFGANRQYAHELCNSLIRKCSRILWECDTRADLVDEETIALMKKAGCRYIHIGIESGNNQILEKMRKGITIEKAISSAEIIRKHGIKLRANFLIGIPAETEQTLKDTYEAMKRTKGELAYSIFTPYLGTEASEYCKKTGLLRDGDDISLYNHQSPENCFCENIKKEKFRQLASEIERYVDRRNAMQNLEDILSLDRVIFARYFMALRNPRSLTYMAHAAIGQLRGLFASIINASSFHNQASKEEQLKTQKGRPA